MRLGGYCRGFSRRRRRPSSNNIPLVYDRAMRSDRQSNPEPVLIAVDAAMQPASVAVLRGQGVIEIRTAIPDLRTDAWLSPAIDDCLSVAGLAFSEIDGFAVTTGPGTFTGIRVGLATCLGLAAPRRLPVAGVLTLEALAAMGCADGAEWIAPCIDARRDQVYGALYHLEPGCMLPFEAAIEPMVADPEAFAEAVSGLTPAPLLMGTGTRYFASPDAGREKATEGLTRVPETFVLGTLSEPLAVSAGRLVARASAPKTAP
jgi:tRNA threonylcarbamoyl adenosine modification protein YeaZ